VLQKPFISVTALHSIVTNTNIPIADLAERSASPVTFEAPEVAQESNRNRGRSDSLGG
jgi:hypothetical protein